MINTIKTNAPINFSMFLSVFFSMLLNLFQEEEEGGYRETVGREDEVIKLLANGDEMKTPESVVGQLTDDYHERAKALQLCEGDDGAGRLDEAIVDFNTVIERNYKNAHAYFRRAFCHKSKGNYDRAAEGTGRVWWWWIVQCW